MARISHILVAALAGIGLLPSGSAMAQQAHGCRDRAEMVEWLAQRFGEQPIGVGLAGPERLLELHVSPEGSWTILITSPRGLSCMLAVGQSWMQLDTAVEVAKPGEEPL